MLIEPDIGGDEALLKHNGPVLIRFLRAIRLHCPNCGSAGIVHRLRLVERCPACRHRFERHEGYWLGAVAINTMVTIGLFVIAFVAATVLTWPDPPWPAITVGVVILNAAFPIVFYPWSKTLWIALDLSMHPAEG